ncbi:MAG: glycosyltransferase family 4 protein [Candidatus Omnitrophota bacterium]
MRILLLTTHLNAGGIGVYTVNLARYLKKSGVDVTVVSSGGSLEGALAQDDVKHIYMDLRTKSEFGVRMWKALPALTRLIVDNGIQLVHAQTRVAQVLGYIVWKFTGVPSISTCHGFFKYRRLSRRMFPCWGRKVIAISDSVRKHLIEDFRVPSVFVTRIYNGIEVEKFSSISGMKDESLMRDTGIGPGTLVIGAIGRLSPVKGFKYLVKAFKGIVSGGGDARLLIVGDGPERKAIKEQIRGLGIGDSVSIVSGNVCPDRYLSLIDIFCLPSVEEGLGLSLMEAMAAGRACVASDVGGVSELILSGEDGILVPPRDPSALCSAIERLASDAGLRQSLGENARKKAEKNFSIRDSVHRTIRVYREVVAESVGHTASGAGHTKGMGKEGELS